LRNTDAEQALIAAAIWSTSGQRMWQQVVYETALAGSWLRALLQLKGVKLLAEILQGSWPDNADFGASTCPSGEN
jgi:hypothetical protein